MKRILTPILVLLLGAVGCTQQKPSSFRLKQQYEGFPLAEEVNTKIDLLYVIDNSASMNVSQDRLRRGFSSFAEKYLRPTWDIRVAVITTDSYLANPAFSAYLQSTITGTTNWVSPYIESRLDTFENPSSNPTLVNPQTGAFSSGLTWADQIPAWGPDYARLLPGVHDGPVAALCSEQLSYFFNGVSQCRIRDDQSANVGISHCLNPVSGETALTQCVNTVQNDTIHSGRPILSTQSNSGTLVEDFMINASVGTSGNGSERGMGSLLQFLTDNETSDTAFFRRGSQRVIIFLADEDDQTITIPSSPPQGFGPFTGYTTSCSTKTVDGYTYRLTSCPEAAKLTPVATIKNTIDSFFADLDGTTQTPNYLVIPIVPLTGAALRELQSLRAADDKAAGNTGDVSVDRGDRYLDLANRVGHGSFALNIATSDYSVILDEVGRAIVQRKSEFTLSRSPTSTEDMIVTIIHADGSSTVVPSAKYSVTDNILRINDMDFVLSLSASDWILVNYQPKTVY